MSCTGVTWLPVSVTVAKVGAALAALR